MKKSWQRIALKIDALSLRERAIVFAVAVLLLGALINTALLDPQYVKQTKLSQQIKRQQSQTIDLQNQIQQRVKSQGDDPNLANLERLRVLRLRITEMNKVLGDLQKGLVSPDRMAELLENVLKRNDRLLLVSLRTLPVKALNESIAASVTGNVPVGGPVVGDQSEGVKAIFKHAVELKVQGNYLDMLSYMRSLEGMPWQLFWGSAQLTVDAYPTATLTLTLFTLSLDKQWLNL